MPRLSNQDYLAYSHWLRDLWTGANKQVFGVLSVNERWDLHAYFQPSKDWTDEPLLDHRQRIVKERPTLPARAGKSFGRINQIYANVLLYSHGDKKRFGAYLMQFVQGSVPNKRGRVVKALAVARPEPDLEKLAEVLLDMARDELAAEQDKKQAA